MTKTRPLPRLFWGVIFWGLGLVAIVATVAVLTTNDAARRAGGKGPHPTGAVAIAPAPRPASLTRIGYDPLSSAERDLAITIALADPVVAKYLAGAARAELIVIERHEETKSVYARGGWDRRADVLHYLYGMDQTLRTTVNLAAKTAEAVDVRANDQPPLTRGEMNRAFDIALADATASARIRGAFVARVGKALDNPEAIERYGFVFVPDEIPEATSPEVMRCGLRRCGLLVLAVQGDVLDTQIVVDLSSGRVVYAGEGK